MRTTEKFIVRSYQECKDISMWLSFLGYVTSDGKLISPSEEDTYPRTIVVESGPNQCYSYTVSEWDSTDKEDQYVKFCRSFGDDIRRSLIEVNTDPKMKKTDSDGIFVINGFKEDVRIGKLGTIKKSILYSKESKGRVFFTFPDKNYVSGYLQNNYLGEYEYIDLFREIIVRLDTSIVLPELNKYILFLRSLGFKWKGGDEISPQSIWQIMEQYSSDLLYLKLNDKTITHGKERTTKRIKKPLIIDIRKLPDLFPSEENKSSKVFICFDKHKEVLENIIDCRIAIEILSEASEFKSCNDVESRDKIIEVRNFSELMGEQLEKNFAIVLDLEEKTYKLVTLPEDKTEGMSEILIEEIIYLMPLSNCLIGFNRHIILEILREHARQNKIIDFSIIANSITSVAVFNWEKSGKKQFWREIFIDRNFYHFYDFYPNHPRSYISIKDSEKLNKLIEKGYRISQLRDKNKEPVKCYLVDEKNKILFQEPEASPYWEEFEIEEDVKSSINSDKILDSENYVIFCRNKEEIVNVLKKLSELGYTWVDDTLISSDFAKNRDKVIIYVYHEEFRISYRPGVCNVTTLSTIESVDWIKVVNDSLKKRNSAVKLCRIKTTLRNLINDRYRWVEKDRRISKEGELKELVYIVDNNKEEIYGYCEENVYEDSILEEVNTVTKSSYSSFKDIDWSEVSLSPDISEEFIEEYKDYLDWELVSSHITLNEDTIGKYGKYLDWNVISKYQVLSPEFMEKYENKLDWEMISKHQPFVDLEKLVGSLKSMYDGCNSLGKLYQETKEEQGWFIGYITREDFDNKPSEFEFRLDQYRNYVCKVKIYWRDLTSTWPNAKKFYKEDENGESMYEEVNRVAGTGFISDRGIDWDIVSNVLGLPEWFIYKYRKELNWLIISNEQILSEVFLKVHEDEDFFYNFVISEKQPFVDPKKLNWYQKSLYRDNNHLGKLYQKTKDIGYFTAFISDVDYIDDKSINGYRFSISSKHGFTKQVKIYWKDLISPNYLVSRFYELSKEGKEDSVMLQNFPRGIVIVKHIDSGDRRVISGILDLFIRKEGFNYVGLNPGEEGIVDNIPYPGESKKDLLMLINKGDKTLTIKEEDGIVFNERGIIELSLSALYRNIKDFVEEKNLDRPENLKILNNDKSINSFKNKKVMKNSMFDGIIEKFKSQYVPEIDNNIMISMDGNLCVKAGDEAVSVSKDSCEIVSYPVEMCFDIPGLLISKPVNMIVPGDIVKFKETYYKVLEVNPNGTIKVISFSTGTISSKKTIKDFVTGSNLVKVIINFMNGINPGLNMQQGMNPVMMAMMFQEGKDSDDMLKNMIMLSMMNPNSGMNAFTGGMMNPVMMAMMMKDSSFAGEGNDMFKMMAVMSMFNNQGGMFQTGFNNACQVNNPSIVNQPKPEKRERVSRKPRAKKVETSGEGGAGIDI